MVQKNLDERLLTYLKEKALLYVDVEGMKNNQQNKKEDTSMNYSPKTAYLRPLVRNAENTDNTTNPYLKNPHSPSVK